MLAASNAATLAHVPRCGTIVEVTVKFIFQYPDFHGLEGDMLDAGAVADVAAAAERAGFDGFAFTEHPAPSASWMAAGGHQTLDPFIALGNVAAVTTRMMLLTYLAVLPYRNPLMVAKAATTLDRLSGGRFVLGVGTGYLKAEYFAVGAGFEDRNARFDDSLEVLRKAWTGEPFDHAGIGFDARNTIQRPRPTTPRIPIWIGGNSSLTLRRVAERADGWMPLIGPAEMSSTVRSPPIESVDAIATRLTMLRELAGDRFADLDVAVPYTDPSVHDTDHEADRHREALAAWARAGATWIIVPGPSAPAPASEAFVAAFAARYITRGT